MDATYRADLRETNDLNFARFDAKLGERRRIFMASAATLLAQIVALVTLFKLFGAA